MNQGTGNSMVDNQDKWDSPGVLYCSNCGYERERAEKTWCDNCIERSLPRDNGVDMVQALMSYFKPRGK